MHSPTTQNYATIMLLFLMTMLSEYFYNVVIFVHTFIYPSLHSLIHKDFCVIKNTSKYSMIL